MASFRKLVFKYINSYLSGKSTNVYFSPAAEARRLASLVQHDAQERTVDFNPSVVFDETQFPELVHEKIDPRARCADHLRERFLRDLGEQAVGLVLFTVAGEQ